ncbi:MAG: ATP-binding cassette domain-containing protein [Pseudomonadota bacterium]
MNKLAQAQGFGADTDDDALTQEYGEKPRRASLQILGERLGFKLAVRKTPVASLTPEDAPCIVVLRSGLGVVVKSFDQKGCRIETPDGETTADLADLAAQSAGIVLGLPLRDADAKRLTEIGAKPQKDDDADTNRDPMAWLAQLVWRRHKPQFAQLFAAALISNLFLVTLPLFIMSVYDRVIPHAAFASLITLTIGVLIVFAADLGLRWARLKFADAIGLRVLQGVQSTIYRRVLFVKLANRPKSAAAISNLQRDLENACLMLPEFMVGCVTDTAFALLIIMLIASISGPVALVTLLGAAVVAGVVFYGATKAQKPIRETTQLRGLGAGQIAETIDALSAVKASGAEHALLRKYERANTLTAVKGHDARHLTRFSSQAAGVIVQATIVASIAWGVVRIDAGAMSIGALAATTLLVGRAVTPIGQLTDQFCRLRSARDALSEAFKLVNTPEEEGGEADGGSERPVHGAFSLTKASYRHEGAEIDALSEISIQIKPGEKIGLIGRNGGGKTTLLHLLSRLYEPTSGAMTIEGVDARQFSPQRLRRDISFMPQETVLFNDTLLANICLGMEKVGAKAFERAVSLSGVDQFAALNPKGYSMIVGPRGEFLSAGERQAVGLARALLRNTPVLLLDEPTSLMDQTAEARVVAAFADAMKETTLILSTHRLRLLALTTRVIVLDRGRIIADGPRDEILKSMGAAA